MTDANNEMPNVPPMVERVSVRVPPFWPEDPAMWFSQLEAQFSLSNVTVDVTKYNYVIANLEPRYAMEIRDLMTSPPVVEKYKTVKMELISRLSASQEAKTKQLLEHEEMGDRKPSQFLRHLRNLAGTAVPVSLIRSLWLGRLPPTIRGILATQGDSDIDSIAKVADAVHDATLVSQLSVVSDEHRFEAMLEKCMAQLRNEIAEVTRNIRTNSRTRVTGQNRNRNRSKSRDLERKRQDEGKCFYHARFGRNATKCTKPCSFQSSTENLQGSR